MGVWVAVLGTGVNAAVCVGKSGAKGAGVTELNTEPTVDVAVKVGGWCVGIIKSCAGSAGWQPTKKVSQTTIARVKRRYGM